MALFTGAFFVAQVSLIIVAKPFYAIFCTSCVPHKPKTGFTACQIVDNLERLGTLWYAMKQIWRTKKIIKMASNIEIQRNASGVALFLPPTRSLPHTVHTGAQTSHTKIELEKNGFKNST